MIDKRYGKPAAAVLSVALLLLLFFSSCNVEPQVGGDAVPEINLVGASKGFFDVTIEEFRLKITGEEINFDKTYPADTKEIRVSLREGENIRFELEAPIASGSSYTGPVKSYGGVAYADLIAGEKTSVDFFLTPFETKILVPDHGGYEEMAPPRLFQIDDDSGWTKDEEVNTTLNNGSPMDIDIDNLGQIWVGYEGGYIELRGDITTIIDAPVFLGNSITSLAFDRKNNYLYFIDDYIEGQTLHRFKADPDIQLGELPMDDYIVSSNIVDITTFYPFGLTVDDKGYIYFAGSGDNGESNKIFKLDFETANIIASSSGTHLPASFGINAFDYPDLLYKDGHIYVTNKYGGADKQILQFDTNLKLTGNFGNPAPDPANPKEKEFFGPSRFLATTSRKIYVIDGFTDGQNGISYNRIASFSDIDGSNWETSMPDIAGDEFLFYYYS